MVAKNNLSYNNTNYDYQGTFNSDSTNNLSKDNTAPAFGVYYRDTSVKFVDEANKDFHLSPSDTAAIDAGTSSVSGIVTTDIDGNPIHTYDIGADDASVYFDSTVMESGGDFSSLSSWEAANQVDLTATTTLVFDCSTASGSIPVGATVVAETLGSNVSTGTGTVTVMATSSSKILLYSYCVKTHRFFG